MSKTFYRIENGAVSKIVENEIGITPLSEFLQNLSEHIPKIIQTPPLPFNCVRYVKTAQDSIFYDVFTVYSQPCIQTVAWRARENSGKEPTNYTVSWPGMLFKFTFKPDGSMLAPRVVICKNRPTRLQERLYKASLPNVFEDSRICMVPQYTPGNFASSCHDTVRSFYTGQAFNNDLQRWPAGVKSFKAWETKTTKDPRWIENVKWTYMNTFGEWSQIPGRL